MAAVQRFLFNGAIKTFGYRRHGSGVNWDLLIKSSERCVSLQNWRLSSPAIILQEVHCFSGLVRVVSCAAAGWFGGLNTSWYPCPRASQLAFVWDISAWLTPELSVRGGCLCPDLVTELLRMEGTRGRSFGETICCWDNSSLLYALQLQTLLGTRTLTNKDTNKWTNTSVAGQPHHFYQLIIIIIILLADSSPDKSRRCSFKAEQSVKMFSG